MGNPFEPDPDGMRWIPLERLLWVLKPEKFFWAVLRGNNREENYKEKWGELAAAAEEKEEEDNISRPWSYTFDIMNCK